MLYKHGELPSLFVEKIERAADVEIISFDPGKALRDDVRWYLRSFFNSSYGDDVIMELERRNLIPKARNHRMLMGFLGNDKTKDLYIDQKNAQLAEFLDSKESEKLDADKGTVIKKHQLPQTDLEYRLEIRRVFRVLFASGNISKDQFNYLEEVIGIPIIGVIEK
jgi:hypothetical protein